MRNSNSDDCTINNYQKKLGLTDNQFILNCWNSISWKTKNGHILIMQPPEYYWRFKITAISSKWAMPYNLNLSLENSRKSQIDKQKAEFALFPSLPLSLCMCIWGSDLSSIQSTQCVTSEECTAVMKTLFSWGRQRWKGIEGDWWNGAKKK